MILPGLTPEEQRDLILSVGTHSRHRILSPVEVARLMKKASDHGARRQQIAEVCHLDGTTMVSRFLRLLRLPEVVQTWVAWEPNVSELSLSAAQEIARLSDGGSQLSMAKLVLESRLTSKEAGNAIMRIQRGGERVDSAVTAVLRLRPRVVKKFVFIGTITDIPTRRLLDALTQHERNSLLREVLHSLELEDMSGTLGTSRFTLVADESTAMGQSADALEASIVAHLRAKLP